MRRLRAASVVTVLIAALAAPIPSLLAPVASATTPGSNGLIAFTYGAGNCQDIYLRRADAGTTKLTKCPRWVGTPAWSPNAKQLAVSYITPTDNSFRLRLALLKATGGTPSTISTGISQSNSPVFSRDGSVLAFAGGDAGDDNLAIYTVPVGGGTATKLTGGNGQVNDEPDWSPAADVIAWAHRATNTAAYDVWTMTVDATGHNPTALTNLTNGAGNSRYPSWSPDGTKIAFASDRSGSWQVYVMNADGSGVVPVTTGSTAHIQPAWSPDGTKIALTAGCTTATCATSGPNDHRVNGNVQIVDVTDLAHPGAPQTVLGTTASEFDPQWAHVCRTAGCPISAVNARSVRLKPIHHLIARGRVLADNAPVGCHSNAPLVLQYENVIDRTNEWPHPNGHWVKEGEGTTTASGRFRMHLPPHLTGWYRVKAKKRRINDQVCSVAASRLRVNNFIRDPKGDSRGPVDIAWGDARIHDKIVTFTLHTYGSFSSHQLGVPCVLFMKPVKDSQYSGSIGCFGGLLLHDQHKPITTKRPDSKTIVYRFKESELDPGFTYFEWAPWCRGTSDHDIYDVAPNDSAFGNPKGFQHPYDMPYLFKHKPTYGRG